MVHNGLRILNEAVVKYGCFGYQTNCGSPDNLSRDMPIGGVGGIAPPNIFKFARKLVKRQPCCKRGWLQYFLGLFVLITIVGQLVKTPSSKQKVSRHITEFKGNGGGLVKSNRKSMLTRQVARDFSSRGV